MVSSTDDKKMGEGEREGQEEKEGRVKVQYLCDLEGARLTAPWRSM